MGRPLALALALPLLLLAFAGCGGSEGASEPTTSGDASAPAAHTLPQGDDPVELDPADFVSRSTTRTGRWPRAASGSTRRPIPKGRCSGSRSPSRTRTKTVQGIEATVVHDLVTEDGEPIEDTYDWYGQDKEGNLWYLGEDTKEYENGKVVSTAGSWEAGVDGALAGIIIPADPQVGMTYRQEYYEGEAEDEGEILSLDEKAEVPFGSFDNLLMTKDTTPLEPDILEHKFYARGVGPVLVLGISGGSDREVLLRFEAGT